MQCREAGWSAILLSMVLYLVRLSTLQLPFSKAIRLTGRPHQIYCIDLVEAPFCVRCEPLADNNYISTRRSQAMLRGSFESAWRAWSLHTDSLQYSSMPVF